jgi:hypothetical protein
VAFITCSREAAYATSTGPDTLVAGDDGAGDDAGDDVVADVDVEMEDPQAPSPTPAARATAVVRKRGTPTAVCGQNGTGGWQARRRC